MDQTTSRYHLAVDRKRRTTWPVQLLREAGLLDDKELVAHPDPDEPGRIVIESRETIKRRIHRRAARGRDRVGHTGQTADELLAERRADHSL